MLEIDGNLYWFRRKEIWFNELPYEIEDYDTVSFLQCRKKVPVSGFEVFDFATVVIDLTQDLGAIWEDMDRKSCRYAINRAIKDGIEVKIDKNYDGFYEIYRSFITEKGLCKEFPTLQELHRIMKYGTLFAAELNGEVLAGSVYLADKDTMRLRISASKRLNVGRKKATLVGNASRLIHWEAIKFAKQKGIAEFDMGGIIEDKKDPRYSVTAYKLSFGGKTTIRYNFRKDYSRILRIVRYLYRRSPPLQYFYDLASFVFLRV